MTTKDILRLRLYNQQLVDPKCKTPAELVGWFGAVQAQDYAGAKWGVGQRIPGSTDETIEQALADGKIVRSWPMRGTLHFVLPEDLRWMLSLLSARIISRSAFRYRELELTDKTFDKSRELFINELAGGKQLTRDEMVKVLAAGKISTAGQRGIHILGRIALEGTICFGKRKGKQQTFALLNEWIPVSKKLDREQSIVELTKRYFQSHGPASIQDFVWWSGLTVADARYGLEAVSPKLNQEILDEQTYWFFSSPLGDETISMEAYLLPPYDEFTVAYKNRSAALDPAHMEKTGNGIFRPTIMIDGKIAGTWKRTIKKNSVSITPHFFQELSENQYEAFKKAANRYGMFLQMPITLL